MGKLVQARAHVPRALRVGLMTLLLAIAGVAHPQPAPTKGPSPASASASTTVGEVVVPGDKARKLPENLPDKVWKDVKVRAQPSHTGNLSRWMVTVCPGTYGLNQTYASFVSGRISEVARRFVQVRPEPCHGINVLVAFTTVPQELMEDVRKNHPGLLGYHYVQEERKLATFKGPIQAWYVTATNGIIDNAYGGNGVRTGETTTGVPSGRLNNGQVSSLRFVLIVVDSNQVKGQPIGRIVDYIATLALSKTGARKGCSPLPSVLDALDRACPASSSLETLTAYDESFLKALYSTNVGQPERGSVALHTLKGVRQPKHPDAGSPSR